MRKAFFLFTLLSLSLAAIAGKPKIGPGFAPGSNDGEGNTRGGGANTEVNLPIGLPESGPEAPAPNEPSGTSNIVYTFDLSDDNGASSANQTHSALEKARDMNAKCVLIRINSFAGGWDAAENIRQEILGYDRPVMVYVNNQTIPAATFISSGADSIYTKKGAKIANNKARNHSQTTSTNSVQENTAVTPKEITSASNQDEESNDVVSMNEILFKAGLGNLTVVEHTPGIGERVTDFLMHPAVVLCILLLTGLIMRRAAKSKLPGPMLYLLVAIVVLYIAPFQVSGFATPVEILSVLLLIAGVVTASRYHQKWITGILLVVLTFALMLIRTGDTQVLLQYGTYSELLTLPSIPLGLVILGWALGSVNTFRRKNKSSRGLLTAEAA